MRLGSAFVHHFDIFLLRHNYFIYLFDRITFFDGVRITLYFDMFELRMEITLQLCFVFDRHCDVFFLSYNYVIYWFDVVTFELCLVATLQLRYAFARHCDVILLRRNDIVLLRHNYVIYSFDVVTFFANVTLYFGTFELRMEITLQLRFVFARHCDIFFITSQSRYFFVRCSYVF